MNTSKKRMLPSMGMMKDLVSLEEGLGSTSEKPKFRLDKSKNRKIIEVQIG